MNKKIIIYLLLYLIANFSGLALGSLYTGSGVVSDWYVNLIKAPWTPPGFVFGIAWTVIGVTFSILMSFLISIKSSNQSQIRILFFISLILNISWNPIFFFKHWIWLGLVVLISLFLVIYLLTKIAFQNVGYKLALFGFPYLIWLLIATSLNLYIVLMN